MSTKPKKPRRTAWDVYDNITNEQRAAKLWGSPFLDQRQILAALRAATRDGRKARS